jgi:hypothetical protein
MPRPRRSKDSLGGNIVNANRCRCSCLMTRPIGMCFDSQSKQPRIKYTKILMAITRTSGQGRPKGALNKRTIEVIDKLAALHCDPITGMARIAMNKNNPVELRARMFVELAQYVAAKRKAVEHSGDAGMIEALLLRLDAEAMDHPRSGQ